MVHYRLSWYDSLVGFEIALLVDVAWQVAFHILRVFHVSVAITVRPYHLTEDVLVLYLVDRVFVASRFVRFLSQKWSIPVSTFRVF